MKKVFTEPEAAVISINSNDVIVTSGCPPVPGQLTPDEGFNG